LLNWWKNKMTNANNISAIRHFYTTWDAAMLAPNVEWRMAAGFPNGGTYHGVSGVFEQWWPRHSNTFSEWRAEPEHFLGSDEAVTVLGQYVGRAAATGRNFEVPFAHIWWMKDGMIAAFDQHCDTLLINQALDEA
jgi:hypothetical protein